MKLGNGIMNGERFEKNILNYANNLRELMLKKELKVFIKN
jgi:hypothetical protein